MSQKTYFRNGRVVTEAGSFHGGVVAEDGLIAQLVRGNLDIGQGPGAVEEVDLAGHVLLPGIIDAHTHFSEPGRTFEGYRSGSQAAAAGGVTTVFDMPLNDLPPTTDRATLAAKRKMVETESVIDYAHWGALVDNNLAALEEQNEDGVVAFKAFLRTVADFPRINDDLLYAGLKKIEACDNILGVHAENEHVTAYLREQLKAAGRIDRRAWNESRPAEQEMEAIGRSIFWAKAAGAQLYICHISLADAVQLVRQAAAEGHRIYGETCAHYLYFDMEDYFRVGPRLRAAPPIRSREEVEKLWQCVLRGEVDVISSDHSPFPPERYDLGQDNVWEGAGGVVGIQSMLPAVITAGVHQRGMPWELVARLMSSNPARIFGVYPQKGALLPGSDADFTIVDPDREWVLSADDLLYRYRQSPYVGCPFKGAVTRTVVRGKTVFQDGRITAEPGHGRLVLRKQH